MIAGWNTLRNIWSGEALFRESDVPGIAPSTAYFNYLKVQPFNQTNFIQTPTPNVELWSGQLSLATKSLLLVRSILDLVDLRRWTLMFKSVLERSFSGGLAMLSLLTIQGCGSGDEDAAVSAGQAPPPEEVAQPRTQAGAANSLIDVEIGRATVVETFRGGQSVLAPAPSDLTPRLSAAEAYEIVVDDALFPETAVRTPDRARFGLFSDTSYGPLDPSGGVDAVLVERPAWIFVFEDVPVVPGGAPPQAGATRVAPPIEPIMSTVVAVVDAATGEQLIGFAEGG